MNIRKTKKIIKIIVTVIIVTLLFATGTVISSSITMENEAISSEHNSPSNPLADYTHTVLVEAVTASWCQYCHSAAINIYNLFNSGLYDFYFVSLVTDRLSPDYAYQRALELNFIAWPHYFFDGGYTSWVGNSGLPDAYISRLNLCGARTVADIDLEMYATWEGDSNIGVTIDVTNNEATPYVGHLHAYVTEIDSRWDTYYGSPYHYAMIGYAMNMDITILAGETYHRQVIWNGATYGFDDIELGNIMVIASVFQSPSYYTDETTAALAQLTHTLTININGSGTVISDPEEPAYPDGTPVIIEGIPNDGWRHHHWSGDLDTIENPTLIIMDTDKTITAHFWRIGDTDGNGIVNVQDFLYLLSVWGSDDHDADFNDDGVVNVSDFLALLANWG